MTAASSSGTNINFTKVNFESIIDSVQRASTATKQAQRIATAAARAFADEAAHLDGVKVTLEKLLAESELRDQ